MAVVKRFLPILIIFGLLLSALSVLVRVQITRNQELTVFRESQQVVLDELKRMLSQTTVDYAQYTSYIQSFVKEDVRNIAFELTSAKHGTEYIYTKNKDLVITTSSVPSLSQNFANYLFIPTSFYTIRGDLYTVVGAYEPVNATQFTLFVRDAILFAAIVLFLASLYYFISSVPLGARHRNNISSNQKTQYGVEKTDEPPHRQYTGTSSDHRTSGNHSDTESMSQSSVQFPQLREFHAPQHDDESFSKRKPDAHKPKSPANLNVQTVQNAEPDLSNPMHSIASDPPRGEPSTIDDIGGKFEALDQQLDNAPFLEDSSDIIDVLKDDPPSDFFDPPSDDFLSQPQEPASNTVFEAEPTKPSEDQSPVQEEAEDLPASPTLYEKAEALLDSEINRAVKIDVDLIGMKMEISETLDKNVVNNITQLLCDLPPQEDLFCHLSEKQFLLLFPNETIQTAKQHAEHLHKTIDMLYGVESVFAITSLNARMISAGVLLRELDIILDRAKEQKNHVQAFSPDSKKYYEAKQRDEIEKLLDLEDDTEEEASEILPPPEIALEITRDLL